jgi:leader peptidase (prepilin peptidase)/N-methyltransferase
VYALKNTSALIASALGIALFFKILVIATRERGMGAGDIRLGFLIGIFNWFPFNILAIFLGFILGALVSSILIIFGKKTMKDTIPFGPFLITGCLISYAFGDRILAFLNII